MLRNYLKTAFRNLVNQKGSAFLNIAGLTLGISSSIILFLLINHVLSFDKFQANYDRIYRVVSESDGNNGRNYSCGIPSPLPVAFRNDFSEAQEVVFTSYRAGSIILVPRKNAEPKKFQEDAGVVFTEPTFFKVFSRNVLIGDAQKGLDEPNEAVISTSLAKKYFEREDVIGETVMYGTTEYRISAVIDDATDNTDFPFNLLLSYETIRKETEEHGWNSTWSDEHCYFLLKEGLDVQRLKSRMPEFSSKYLGDKNYDNREFVIQPLSEVHYDERYGAYSYNTVGKGILMSLSLVAIFLIITACINFVNLSTAEAIKRSKEVGIRKTLGSSKSQLVLQFLGETAIVTFISIVFSLGLAQLGLSFLNPFLEKNLALNLTSDINVIAFLVGVFLVVSLFSGLYPSFVLSSYKPALALKNKISNTSSGFNLRRSLVVLQFFISQFFIIGTIVIISQMNYFTNKEMGFSKDAIISIPIPEDEVPAYEQENQSSKMRVLATEVSRLSGVENVSLCSAPPASGNVSGTGFILEGEDDSKRKDTQVKQVDGNYATLFDLTLLAGKNIDDLDTATGFMVNRKLAEIAGFNQPQDMVGTKMKVWGKNLPVVGVVENFHATSLRDQIEPLVLFNRIRGYHTLSLKVNAQSYQTTIDEVKKLWEATYPMHLFSYEFMDEQIKRFYEGEKKMSILLTGFTSMAICIGCLGLFGLATFMANQKTKEIGVRKVLGATVESIVLMFSKEYAKLIIIGFVLAAPASWFIMNMWLDEFAYKIDLGLWIFASGLAVTLFIALLTVGYRSLRAATANPVNSLRYE